MIGTLQRPARLLSASLAVFFPVLVAAQTTPADRPVDSTSPVGHWIAEHTSMGGIGSWWEFRYDGTLTTYFGVAVSVHIERSGDTFMTPSGVVGGAPVRATYTIHGDVLTVENGPNAQTSYTRLDRPPNPADPLIGSWRQLPRPAETGGDPNAAILESVKTTKGTLAFTPDGMQHLRIPLGTRDGLWDAAAHNFHIQEDPATYSFERRDSKLLLGQPPNGKEIDSYLPDPLFDRRAISPVSPGKSSRSQNAKSAFQRGPDAVVPPKVIHIVEPSFSEKARKRHIQGEVTGGADGSLRDPHVVKSAADAYADLKDRKAALTLDQKAIEAVMQYTFAPATLHDKPVSAIVTIGISFQSF